MMKLVTGIEIHGSCMLNQYRVNLIYFAVFHWSQKFQVVENIAIYVCAALLFILVLFFIYLFIFLFFVQFSFVLTLGEKQLLE